MVRRAVTDKNKVLILQRILESKGMLFGENHSAEEKNSEWKKIAEYAKKTLKIHDRDFKYFKGPFWYGCRTSLARKLLDKKKLPLSRAHLLIMDIIGKDLLKTLHDADVSSQEDVDTEMSSINDSNASTPSKLKDIEDEEEEEMHPRIKRASEGDFEELKEIREMKKRKLALEIEHTQILLDKEKFEQVERSKHIELVD